MSNKFKISKETFTEQMYIQYTKMVSQISDKYKIIGRGLIYGEVDDDDSSDSYAALHAQLCSFLFDQIYMTDVLACAAPYSTILKMGEIDDSFLDRAAKYMSFPEILTLVRPSLDVELTMVSAEGFSRSLVCQDPEMWASDDLQALENITTVVPPIFESKEEKRLLSTVEYEDVVSWEVDGAVNDGVRVISVCGSPKQDNIILLQLQSTIEVTNCHTQEVVATDTLTGEACKVYALDPEALFKVSLTRRVRGLAFSCRTILDRSHFKWLFSQIRRRNSHLRNRHPIMRYAVGCFEEWLSRIHFPIRMMPHSIYLHLIDYVRGRKRRDWFSLLTYEFFSWDHYSGGNYIRFEELKTRMKRLNGHHYYDPIHFEDHLAEYYGPRMYGYVMKVSPLDDVYDTVDMVSEVGNQ